MSVAMRDPRGPSDEWKSVTTTMKKFFALLFVIMLVTGSYMLLNRKNVPVKPQIQLITSEPEKLNGRIELTVRTSLKEETLRYLLCSLLRSASLFWNPHLGDVLIILDAEEKFKTFPYKLRSLGLPFNFRFAYEEEPRLVESFERLAREFERPYGYMRMLYSSFLMDKYTTASIIAWIDTDAVFTFPVTNQSIFRNGKLIVKGMDNLRKHQFVDYWNKTTYYALGLPLVSDFMSYFPVYVYRSTIKNCREYILKRLGTSDLETAYFKMSFTVISPVNIIMSYAYYFERERYNWHIDTGLQKLKKYNELNLPKQYPLFKRDTLPEPHVTIHSRYYESYDMDPLQRAICYAQKHLGMMNLTHCKSVLGYPNLQLFEFQTQPVANHLNSWCYGQRRLTCLKIISERYKNFVDAYKKNKSSFILDTSLISVIDEFAYNDYQIRCWKVISRPFS